MVEKIIRKVKFKITNKWIKLKYYATRSKFKNEQEISYSYSFKIQSSYPPFIFITL